MIFSVVFHSILAVSATVGGVARARSCWSVLDGVGVVLEWCCSSTSPACSSVVLTPAPASTLHPEPSVGIPSGGHGTRAYTRCGERAAASALANTQFPNPLQPRQACRPPIPHSSSCGGAPRTRANVPNAHAQLHGARPFATLLAARAHRSRPSAEQNNR